MTRVTGLQLYRSWCMFARQLCLYNDWSTVYSSRLIRRYRSFVNNHDHNNSDDDDNNNIRTGLKRL